MVELEQQRIVDLDRGLFYVTYKNAEDHNSPPKIVLSAAQGHERAVEFILHPDATEPSLWRPNSAVVVRTLAPARLRVQVSPSRAGGSRAATVSVEPIQSGLPTPSTHGFSQNVDIPSTAQTDAFRLRGHVAGIGDVMVGPNAWIAGPAAPSRIEGLTLEWPNKPSDLDIRYAVQLANAQAGSATMVPLGTFAGTRGRALPLTGVVLEMNGNNHALQFSAEAIFLSAPTLRAVGRRVVLSGPTGREPLVGLRIAIEPVANTDFAANEDIARPVTGQSPASSGRVRVFRSRPRQEAASG